MFLATGILSKLMMILYDVPDSCGEDMPTTIGRRCEIGHPIRLTCNRGRAPDEHANSSNWINAEKQLEK
jgi:hypothetical protein